MVLVLALLKWVLVVAVMAVGLDFVLVGAGASVPYLELGSLHSLNVPAGVAVMLIGVGLARFWRVKATISSGDWPEEPGAGPPQEPGSGGRFNKTTIDFGSRF